MKTPLKQTFSAGLGPRQDMETGRTIRRRAHDPAVEPKRRSDRPHTCGGTGSTGQSEEDSQSVSGSEVGAADHLNRIQKSIDIGSFFMISAWF